MRIKGIGDKAQKSHIRALKDFSRFIDRSPNTATPDNLRAYQLHMTENGVTPSTYNARVIALRFFFGMTCGREEMKRYMQFRREPRKLPIGLSVEDVSNLLAAALGPGLKCRAALSIGYGAGLRASEMTHLKVRDIDSAHMLIHVEQGKGGKDRDVMLSLSLLDLLRNYWCEARPKGWLFPGQSRVDPISSRQLNRAFTSAKTMAGIKKPATLHTLRHCPKCRGPAARDWMAARSEDVLPVAYFHVVFTLPVEIANIACWNKKAVYALLFKASAKTVATIAADPKRLGARVGMTRVLHTLGIGVMLNARLWRDPIPRTST